jgi:hypothetical protein
MVASTAMPGQDRAVAPGDTNDTRLGRTGGFVLAVLLAGGLGLRLGWMQLTGTLTHLPELGEASRAALAMARTGTIADAFFPGQGPTAHLMPVMVTLAASVLRSFGPETLAPTLFALVQALAAWLLGWRLFGRIGASPTAQLGGMAILTLLPAYIVQECADFRVWEGALAAALGLANLLLLAELERQDQVPRPAPVVAAVLAALTFFTSPTAGIAAGACWGWFAVRRLPPVRTAKFAGLAALALSVAVAPWLIRNQQQLGAPIVLRSNFGLELAVANHPAAVSTTPPLAVLRARMAAIHPYANPAGEARLRAAGGEIAYSRALGREARGWIAAHPLDFALLSLRHYRQFYVPERWQGALTNWQTWNTPRIELIRIVALLALAGLLLGLLTRRRFYGTLTLYIAVAGLPYALVQPIPRYAYPLWPVFAFLAAELLTITATRLLPKLKAPAS